MMTHFFDFLCADRFSSYDGWSCWCHNIGKDDIEAAWQEWLEKGGEKSCDKVYLTPANVMARAVIWWKHYLHSPPGVLFESVVQSMLENGFYAMSMDWVGRAKFDYQTVEACWAFRTMPEGGRVSLNALRSVMFTPKSLMGGHDGAMAPLAEDACMSTAPLRVDRLAGVLERMEAMGDAAMSEDEDGNMDDDEDNMDVGDD